MPNSWSSYIFTHSSWSSYIFTHSSWSSYIFTHSSWSSYIFTPSSWSSYIFTHSSWSSYIFTHSSWSSHIFTHSSWSSYLFAHSSWSSYIFKHSSGIYHYMHKLKDILRDFSTSCLHPSVIIYLLLGKKFEHLAFFLVHDVALPHQKPSAWQVLLLDPPRLYPTLQLNMKTLKHLDTLLHCLTLHHWWLRVLQVTATTTTDTHSVLCEHCILGILGNSLTKCLAYAIQLKKSQKGKSTCPSGIFFNF